MITSQSYWSSETVESARPTFSWDSAKTTSWHPISPPSVFPRHYLDRHWFQNQDTGNRREKNPDANLGHGWSVTLQDHYPDLLQRSHGHHYDLLGQWSAVIQRHGKLAQANQDPCILKCRKGACCEQNRLQRSVYFLPTGKTAGWDFRSIVFLGECQGEQEHHGCLFVHGQGNQG